MTEGISNTEAEKKQDLSGVLLKVAWLAILLGVGMEILLLIVAIGFGKFPEIKVLMANLVQKISWSTFVCMGIAIGTAASKMRIPLSGLAGLISGPAAFFSAKAIHKSTLEALAIAGPVASQPSAMMLAFIKGIEYAVLGGLFVYLGKFPAAGMRVHALVGLAIGIVFGGTVIFLAVFQSAQPIPLINLLTRSINEILFPVGCSLVLYSAKRLGVKKS